MKARMIQLDRVVRRLSIRTMSAILMTIASLVMSAGQAQAPVRTGSDPFGSVDGVIDAAVASGAIPGAVLLVGHHGRVVHRKAFGMRSLEPVREAMTPDTIFDLASLTKCIVTATSIMQLVQDGRIRINDTVATYLPEFAQNGKQDITVRELLTHYSGLRPDLDLTATWTGRDASYELAMHEKPANPPGSQFVYSDINFETLGFIVEKVSGMALADYASQHIFTPLGMNDTRYLPSRDLISRIAPTQYDEHDQMLRGVVHDPTARRMGGVAGHAGLFSTADDLARFAEELLSGSTILSRAAIEKMSTPQQPANAASLRGLGWDIDSPFSSNRGELLPVGSFGHTGFTGTSLWIDPITDTYIILLTNAVHPRGGKGTVALRAKVATAVVKALDLSVTDSEKYRMAKITGYNESLMASRRLTFRNGMVKTGIDVLESHDFRELGANVSSPIKIGVVTNQTGVDSHGQRTIDVLARAPGVKLSAIFSPEHGVTGQLDTTDIGNSLDAATNIPVYSLYGDKESKRRPTTSELADLDEIVFDIQDVGARFYTYESTLGYVLEAAAKADKKVVVLDRPDPIGGSLVQGPVADAGRESFVSYSQTPIRHGMTMGELARMFNTERRIEARLAVVPMEGWMRGDLYDSTGELWTNPSPNMRSLTEAILYPGIGMIEGTNVSVGRGTDTPFELVGAPWIKAVELASYLNARQIEGVRFIPIKFTPVSSVYDHTECEGVQIAIVDRNSIDSPELGLEIAAALEGLYPKDYKVMDIDKLMVSRASLDGLAAGQDPRRIAQQWMEGLERFSAVRAKYLIY